MNAVRITGRQSERLFICSHPERVRAITRDTREVRDFLVERQISRKDDPFKYWKEHHVANYAGIAKVARKYLPIPGPEVTSGRMFSAPGDVIISQRENMKPVDV